MANLLSRLYNFVTDKTNGVKILSAEVDAELNQLVAAINRDVLCSSSAPGSPIAGQTWVDTTNKILKIYRNNEWVVMGVVHISATGGVMATPQEGDLWYDTTLNTLQYYTGAAWVVIGNGDVLGPATNTANSIPQWNGANSKTLKDGLVLDTDTALTANSDSNIPSQKAVKAYADTKQAAGAAAGGDLTGTYPNPTINSGKVITTHLKTAESEVSTTPAANLTFAGGQYCHYPQVKNSITSGNIEVKIAADPTSSSYVTNIYIYGNSGGTNYAKTLYHTASGIDYWLWLLVDKITKEVLSMSGAPDHPACGNGGDFNAIPHPFRNYNPDTQDIILIEKDQAKLIQDEAKVKGLSVLELVDRDYKIDLAQTHPYVPIHSGKFSPEETPVMVESIPDYIAVRKIVPQTDKDKSDRLTLQTQRIAEFEAKKAQEEQDRVEAIAILKNLGLQDKHIEALSRK